VGSWTTNVAGNHPQEYGGKEITERLDEVYGEEDSVLDPVVVDLQRRSLPEDE
jgi:hypothetical protein